VEAGMGRKKDPLDQEGLLTSGVELGGECPSEIKLGFVTLTSWLSTGNITEIISSQFPTQ
jgi:hypothetical protein